MRGAARSRKGGGVRRTIGLLAKWAVALTAAAACCAGGAAVSGLLRPALRLAGGSPDVPEAGAPTPGEETQAASEAPTSPGLAGIDQLLTEGRYTAVPAVAEAIRETTAGAARDALDYRVGLALELLARRGEALEAYAAVAARSPETPAGAAAAVGEARVCLRLGEAARARRLLAALLLRAGRPPLRGHAALDDVPHLAALAAAREAGPPEAPGPCNDVPARPAAEPPVGPALAAVKWDAVAAPPDPGYQAPAVQQPGPKPETWTVTAAARQATAADFLSDLAAKAGLRAEWGAGAREQAAARTLTVAADRAALPELLHAAAAAADLACEPGEGKVTFAVPAALPPAERQAAARRALLAAAAANPEHPLAAAVEIELGNLDLAAGRLREAAGSYERLLRERPRASAAEAYFNLGLTRARSGEREPARDAFYRVVDLAPDGPLAPLAYLRVGRLYLEEGNPSLAARALRRAQAAGSAGQPTAAGLALAAAELLDNNPRAAHAALAAVRRGAGEEPFARTAPLLDALARHRAGGDPGRATERSGDLLEALLCYREEPLLGPVGLVLAGQGYRDLGLGDEMAARYEKALPGVGEALALSMKADLAEHLLASGKKGATPLLHAVAAAGGPHSARAELRLAEMAYKGKRLDECLSRCRKVLGAGDAALGGEAARLMGKVYTQKGDHAAAARCFAGRPPAAEQAANPGPGKGS